MTDPREQAALRDRCTVFLTGHGPVRAADLLASIPADTVPDRYGEGGVVAELEAEIAGLLGQPAAVYLPSGTMAQQSVLRVHADRRQRSPPSSTSGPGRRPCPPPIPACSGSSSTSATPPAPCGPVRSATSSPP